MTRHLRGWNRSRRDGDAALDALLAETWEDGTATLARVLDLKSGRAALIEAARRLAADGYQAGEGSAESAVRDQADALLSAITAEIRLAPGPAHSAVLAQLAASRQFLIQLRAGLAARSLTKRGASDLVDSIDHALEDAGRSLRRLPAGAGQAAIELSGRLSAVRQQLPELAGRIRRLFDEADEISPLVPAPSH